MTHNSVDRVVLARQNRYQALLVTLVVLLAIAVSGSLIVLFLQNNKLSDLARSNQNDSRLLIECTTPPELRDPPVVIDPEKSALDCYTRTRAETGQVVKNVRSISIAAAACGSAYPGDVKATEACVNKTLGDK